MSKTGTPRSTEKISTGSTIFTICIVTFFSIMSYSMLAPFYPLQAEEKGVEVFYIGFIIGTQSVFFIISSYYFGKNLRSIGKENAILIGCSLEIVAQACLAILNQVEDTRKFVVFSFLTQALAGLGSGLNSVASLALIVAISKKKDRANNIGYNEAATGIGFLAGPLFGSFMFELGGYELPFAAASAIYFIFMPILWYYLQKCKLIVKQLHEDKEAQLTNASEFSINSEYNEVELSQMLGIARFTFGLLAQILVVASISFGGPSLAIHLKDWGYPPFFIGLCFTIPAVIYASVCPLMYLLTDRLPKRGVIVLGMVIMSTGALFVGTSPIIGLHEDSRFILFGLMLIGFAASMITIPVLPEMIESVERRVDLNYNPEQVHNFLSGIFVTSTGVGDGMGPMLSSLLNHHYGFQEAQTIFGFGLIAFTVLYFFMCGNFGMFVFSEEEKDYNRRSTMSLKKKNANSNIEAVDPKMFAIELEAQSVPFGQVESEISVVVAEKGKGEVELI